MIRKIAAVLFLTVALGSVANAQRFDKARLDSFFNILAARNKNMGSLAISSSGVLVYQRAIGYAALNDKDNIPATTSTKYRIGSITKMFTAVMIFQLIEEHKLALDTKLAAFYPQLPNADKITISQLLDHRSGLHNFTSDSLYTTYMAKPMAEKDMIALLAKQKPDFEPDTKAQYSNTNFVLLGFIVQKITGKPYADELKRRVTAKIGLKDTYYGSKVNPQNNEAYSYTFNGKWNQETETDMSIPGGAGAIVSTPTDLVKFIEALFDGKLVSDDNLKHMKTMKDSYGMAMFAIPFYDKKGFGHTGGIDGFSSELIYFPDDRLAIAYISNGVVYGTNDVVIGALSTYFDKPFVIPTFKTVDLKTADLDKYLGNYTSTQIALKITVTKNNALLIAQATGQPALTLDATGLNLFEFTQGHITLQFDPDKGELIVLQGGQRFLFTRVK